MSGHSKWAKIHRKKGLADQERGRIFARLFKEIYIVAKGTDGNPDTNAGLRVVVEKAKAQNMPKDNIQKAIDKATGSLDGVNYEEIRYEGYGPNGIAVMVDCLTDNRNRTASMVRSTFTKRGGNLGTDGSVSYLFEKKGILEINKTMSEDDLLLIVLEAKAEDLKTFDDTYQIITAPENFIEVKENLEQAGIKDFSNAEVTYLPKQVITLDDEKSEKAYSLIESLEELDDVQAVYSNLD